MRPQAPFTIRYRIGAAEILVLIPEIGAPRSLPFGRDGAWTVISMPQFPIHALLIIN
jgi:hypothetical protein